jgi:hypothetical protein
MERYYGDFLRPKIVKVFGEKNVSKYDAFCAKLYNKYKFRQ